MFPFIDKSLLSSGDQRATEILWVYTRFDHITRSTQMLNLGSNKVEVVDDVNSFVSRMRLSENTQDSAESLQGF